MKKTCAALVILGFVFSWGFSHAAFFQFDKELRQEQRQAEIEGLQRQFEWWPTDARPVPVKDRNRGGYWWWPTSPGQIMPWGNRGYVYVYKIIFDYKAEELPPPAPGELRPSLLVRKVIKDVRALFDYDKSALREDAILILTDAVRTLRRNPEAKILITGHADQRGSEAYNERLARARAETVAGFMMESGITEDRIRIVSRGKLDALASLTDLVGMQKDRNAHFVIAEVEEVMLPYQGPPQEVEAEPIGEDKYLVEEEVEVESAVKVSTREYIVKSGDTLSKIAKEQLGSAHRWVYLYELNKDRIKDPHKLKAGQKIVIPVE